MTRPQCIIIAEGGVVQDALFPDPEATYLLVDWDAIDDDPLAEDCSIAAWTPDDWAFAEKLLEPEAFTQLATKYRGP